MLAFSSCRFSLISFIQKISINSLLALVSLFWLISSSTLNAQVYEAEEGSFSGASLETNHIGFTGGGFVDYTGEGVIEWTVNVPEDGWYDLSFRYALNAGNRPLDVLIDEALIADDFAFPATGDWDQWASVSLRMQLNQGSYLVKTATTGSSGANIDHLEITALVPDSGVDLGDGIYLYEAENGYSAMASVDSEHTGFTGTGFVNFIEEDYLEWDVVVHAEAEYYLNFVYALLEDNRPVDIYVDGQLLVEVFGFPATGDWTQWESVRALSSLTAGPHAIRLETTGLSGANIDSLILEPVTAQSGELLSDGSTRYEAEEGYFIDGSVDDNHEGYTGAGFLNYLGEGFGQWRVEIENPGDYLLTLRYALAQVDRPLELSVNGVVIQASLSFPTTGSWTTWSEVDLEIPLHAGLNIITATPTGLSAANVDHLRLLPLTPANEIPQIQMSSPSEGDSITLLDSLQLQASANDQEDGDLSAAITWNSSVDGALGMGNNLSVSLTAIGSHVISASVIDSDGATATVSVSIQVSNNLPSVTITSPATGDTFTVGDMVSFAGSANDAEDGDVSNLILWQSDVQGVLDTGTAFSASLLEGVHVISASVTDAHGGSATTTVSVDVIEAINTVPQISITAPSDGAIFADNESVTFQGQALDLEEGDLSAAIQWSSDIDGVLGNGASISVGLSAGMHQVSAAVSDGGGLNADVSVNIIVNAVPVLTISSPSDGSIFNEFDSISLNASALDAEEGDLGAAIQWSSDIDGALGSGEVLTLSLSPGTHLITASVIDGDNASASESVSVTVENSNPPLLTINAPTQGSVFFVSESTSLSGTATDVEDGDLSGAISWVSDIQGNLGSGNGLTVTLLEGTHDITASVSDSAGFSAAVSISVTILSAPLPPDPVDVAPTLSVTHFTSFQESSEFLYSGANPIQTGVAPGTITEDRAAVVRGDVRDKNNSPLLGVTVSIKDHPEFGETLSRADGMFDLAVNGGGLLVVSYEKPGFLPVHRKVKTPWQDFVFASDVIMLKPDSQSTLIDPSDTSQDFFVGQGSVQTGSEGSRQVTVLFPQDINAVMTLQDGSSSPLATMTFRATEYTAIAGEQWSSVLPAPLPPSRYGFAVELSLDEAIAAGADRVDFDQLMPFYVDNYLQVPTGVPVPGGYYDREAAAWVAGKNGRVIEILSISGGMADIDIDGTGVPADAAGLSALGITDSEREELALLYAVGDTLWRMRINHFSSHFCGWGFSPVGIALPPPEVDLITINDNRPLPENASCQAGCIIEAQSQTLGEEIPITGSGFSLNYRSNNAENYKLTIPVSDDTLTDNVASMIVIVSIAGQLFEQSFTPHPNTTYEFVWDNETGYEQEVLGLREAEVTIIYTFAPGYFSTLADAEDSWGWFGADGTGEFYRYPPGVVSPNAALVRTYKKMLGGKIPDTDGLGGWTINAHHTYDPYGDIFHGGDGDRRSSESVSSEIATVAGTGELGPLGDGGAALQASLSNPGSVAFDAAGAMYIADTEAHRIRKVSPAGIITTVAGNGVAAYAGDGGPATTASIDSPTTVIVGSDGVIYISDLGNSRVRKVTTDGIISTVAGNGNTGLSGLGGPATSASIGQPGGLALDGDGRLYIASPVHDRILKVSGSGNIRSVVGTDAPIPFEEGTTIALAKLDAPSELAFGPDGSLYFIDSITKIRKVNLDGTVTTVAGNGVGLPGSGAGGPAIDANIRPINSLLVAGDGSIYVSTSSLIWDIQPDGVINVVNTALIPAEPYSSPDGTAINRAFFVNPTGLALAPNGLLHLAENNKIRTLSFGIKDDPLGAILFTSRASDQLYIFDAEGVHQFSGDSIVSSPRLGFSYTEAGYLEQIRTIFADFQNPNAGDKTTIQRDINGDPLSITAPDGQVTTLSLDTNGYLESVTNPAGESHQMLYDANGLMTEYTNPRGNTNVLQYTDAGFLEQDDDPVGGGWVLDRIDDDDGYTVTMTSGEGREYIYDIESQLNGDRLLTNTAPNGTQSATLFGVDTSESRVAANGTMTYVIEGPDPRFGMMSPVPEEMRISVPSGLESVITTTRDAVLLNPAVKLTHTELSETVSVNGRVASQVYNAFTRTYTNTSPEGRITTTLMNSYGRVLESEVEGLNAVNYNYDDIRGRLTSIVTGDGEAARQTMMTYDSDGYLDTFTDAVGRTVSYDYDQAGRVTQQTLPDMRIIQYDYDENGNLTSLTPPGQPAHTFMYTDVDLASEYAPPNVSGAPSPQTAYQFNKDKQLTQVTRPDGQLLTYNYGASSGQLLNVTIPRGNFGYGYDVDTGQLTTVTDPDSNSLGFTYDGFLPITTTWAGDINGFTTNTFDNNFRLIQRNINGNFPISFGYDDDSLLTSAGAMILDRDTLNGLLTDTTLGTITTSRDYTDFAEIEQYTVQEGGNTVFDLGYSRDKVGRLTQKSETIQGVSTTTAYDYDDAGRLIEVDEGGIITTFGYDLNSNRTHVNGVLVGTYDAQDRMTSYGDNVYAYSENGELETKTNTLNNDVTSYDYDVFSNLMQVTLPDSTVIDYVVDGSNRRIGKKVNGSLVQGFLYAGQLNPIAELNSGGFVSARFIYADKGNVPAYMEKGGNTYRIISDHLGSPRLVINTADGTVVQRMDYDVWGNVTLDTNPGFQPFGFAGGIYDTDTELTRFGVRDYDPEIGRWTSKDPIGFLGGSTGLYTYVGNDPVNFVDPTGLEMCPGQESANEPFTIDLYTQEKDLRSRNFGEIVENPKVTIFSDLTGVVGMSKWTREQKVQTRWDERIFRITFDDGVGAGWSKWSSNSSTKWQIIDSATSAAYRWNTGRNPGSGDVYVTENPWNSNDRRLLPVNSSGDLLDGVSR